MSGKSILYKLNTKYQNDKITNIYLIDYSLIKTKIESKYLVATNFNFNITKKILDKSFV